MTSPCSEFVVAGYRVDTEKQEITSPDGVIEKIEPRVLSLFCYLIDRPGQLISRQQLIDEVWQGVVVSDDALSYALSRLRKHFADDSRSPRFLESIPKKGVRWLVSAQPALPEASIPQLSSAPVHISATSRRVPMLARGLVTRTALVVLVLTALWWLWQSQLPPKPVSYAVMIPEFLEPEQQALAESLHEDLMIALSEQPELRVAGRRSVLEASRQGVTIDALADRLNVDAIVHTRLSKREDRWSLYLEVLAGDSGEVLWARNYESASAEQLQLNPIFGDLRQFASHREVISSPPQDLSWQEYRVARRLHHAGAPDSLAQAEIGFRKALRINPDNGYAWAGLAEVLVTISENDWQSRPQPLLDEARQCAQKARELLPNSVEPWLALANIALKTGDKDAARNALERALAIHPNHGQTLLRYGELAFKSGQHRQAEDYLQRALALDPLNSSLLALSGLNAVVLGRLDQGLDYYRQQQALEPGAPGSHRNIAGILHQRGQWAEAYKHYRAAIDKGYNRPVGLLEIATLQRRLGNELEAAEWIKRGLSQHRSLASELDDWIMQFRWAAPADIADDPITLHSPLADAIAAFIAGDQRAMEALIDQQPESFWFNARTVRVAHYSPAVFAYAVLKARDSGKAARWRQQIQAMLDSDEQQLESYYGRYLIAAQLAVLDGKSNDAMTFLQRASALGFKEPARLHNDPWLKQLLPALVEQDWYAKWQQLLAKERKQLASSLAGWLPAS